jgi:hypothetical protein
VVSRKKKKAIPSDVTMIAVKEDDKTDTVLVKLIFDSCQKEVM